MKTLKEKTERLVSSNSADREKILYEWVKTGVVTLKEFRELIGELKCQNQLSGRC